MWVPQGPGLLRYVICHSSTVGEVYGAPVEAVSGVCGPKESLRLCATCGVVACLGEVGCDGLWLQLWDMGVKGRMWCVI